MAIFPLRYFDSKPIPVMFQSTWNTVRIQDLWSKMSLHRSRADDQERIEKKSKTHHPLEAACLCFLHSVSTFRTWFQSRSSRPRTLLEYEIQCQKRCYINHNSTSESARVQSHLRKKNVPDFRFSGTVFVFRKVIFFKKNQYHFAPVPKWYWLFFSKKLTLQKNERTFFSLWSVVRSPCLLDL